ncbi:uncharacterized protein LTR77_005440 [Saxophila tyrrhenica]|uniref:Major facilitator superfamily (MFS) profile domain-containing protein n=1 Tax=Saxophila tyrrhenica TaxID=1690608 RepID=A0AAV9PBY9_9PEZI|nr:hypothetical protein LTR77_005440 [Saxophila tyrrhenica]
MEKPAETGDSSEQQLDSSNASNDDEQKHTTPSTWHRISAKIFWVPPNCRWDPEEPPKFSMALNILFAFAGAFTVANLYYNHPILNILARDFGVSYDKVAQIPTVAQAGYAVGLFFLCPLGDLLKRRPFVLSLVLFTATMSIGLCVTDSLEVFSAIQFITGVTTVTPQLMLPLVGDLAPPNKRAAALSIVVSGFVLGILVARLLSGIMTNYTSWRNVYWMSVGLQYAIFGSLWAFMPDYPATNKRLNYFKMLWSMPVMLTKHPILVQACLISYFTSATFTSFWTVLTFLLAGPPYRYDSVTIGLFALIGIGTMFSTPLYARLIIDRFVPWFSVILGMTWSMIGICVGAYTGKITVAGPIIQAFFLDLGMQTAQIANRSSIYAIEPQGRNRVNTCFMVFTFFGQLTGTSVGAQLYSRGGWVGSQSFSVGCIGMAYLLTFARGPFEKGWIGWHGGLSIRKKHLESADGHTAEARNPLRRMTTKEKDAQAAKAAEDGDLEKQVREEDQRPAERAMEDLGGSGNDDGMEIRDDVEKGSSREGVDGVARSDKQPG